MLKKQQILELKRMGQLRPKEELKKIKSLLSKIDKDLVKSLSNVENDEALDIAKYLLISKLKELQLNIEIEFKKKKNHTKKTHSGIGFIQHKISKIPSKIKLIEVDYDKEEFKKFNVFIDSIKRDLENV
jgi:hypothetical protein